MRKIFIALLATVCCLGFAKQRTTRSHLRAAAATSSVETNCSIADTIRGDSAARMIHISGYEKPLRSRHETMLVTNNDSSLSVTWVSLEITYCDMQGRTLHKRNATSLIDLPPKSTRLIDLKSWDVNSLFYYHLNTPTRTSAQGTPYRVTITPNACVAK
jgi:hypothetical protein